MSRAQPNLARPAKGREEVRRRGGKASTETERAGAPVLDPESEDSAAGDRRKLKFLKEQQGLKLEEMVQTLTCHIRKLWEAKVAPPEAGPSKGSGSRKGRRDVKDSASAKTWLAEKIEDSKTEDTESSASARNPAGLRRKSVGAQTHGAEQGKEWPPKAGVGRGPAGAPRRHGGQRSRKVLGEAPQRGDSEREAGAAQRAGGEGRRRGPAGASLTLAADSCSAALEVGPPWSRIFSILGENGFDPQFLCRVELAFQCDGEMQTFSDLQSLRKFSSQKALLKDLLRDVFEQSANSCPRGRQRKRDNLLTASQCGAGDPAGDGLNFLFIKEVNVAGAAGRSPASPTWKGEESSQVEEQEAPWLEEEGEEEEESWGQEAKEGGSWEEEEEGEETWGSEGQENSGTEEEGGGSSEMEEPQEGGEGSGMEEGTEPWAGGSPGQEGGEASVLGHSSRVREKEELVQNQEAQVEEEEAAAPQGPGTEVHPPTSPWSSLPKPAEGRPSEGGRCSQETPSAASGVAECSGKERNETLGVEELTPEEADLIQQTEENFRRRVVSILRALREEVEDVRQCHPEDAWAGGHLVDSLWGRVSELEGRVGQLDDQVEEVARAAAQMSRQLVNNEKLRVREDKLRSTNVRVVGVPEKDTKENRAEDIVGEILEEHFPDLGVKVVSAQRVPDRVDERKLTPRHILVTFWSPNERERVLKASREREVTYRGKSIRLTADFSLGTLDARSQWRDIVRVLQDSGFHPRIRYPAKLTIDFEGKAITFFDIAEFRRFVSRVPSLRQVLGNVL